MAVGKQQGLFVSEEFSETSQRRGEGLVRLVSVRIGPEDSAQSLFAYVLPPHGDQRLEHLDRLVLGLPGSRNFFPLPYDPEPAERVHLDGPGPVVRLEDRAVRKQVPASYQLLHVVHLDPFREGSGGEFLEKAGTPEEQGEKTVPSPDLHPLVFATLKLSHILPFDTRKLSHPGLSPRIVLEDVTSSARGGRKGCSTWWTWNTSANSNSCNTGRSGRSAGDWGSRATPSPSIFPPPIPRPGIVRRSLVPGQCWGPSKA